MQMWYGFVDKLYPENAFENANIDERGWLLVWAGDSQGSTTENNGEGQIQRNLITFDPRLVDGWRAHLSRDGGWVKGQATEGRRRQRAHLLETWKNLLYVCPFPNGNAYLTPGPALNMIRPADPTRRVGGERYPNSRILRRSDYIN